MKGLGLGVLALVACVVGATAEDFPSKADPLPGPEQRSDVTEPGALPGVAVADLTPGDRAPSFELDSSNGRPVSLSDLKGRWAILVFDVDRSSFASLGTVSDSINAMGARLYGVCEDGAPTLTRYIEKQKLRFSLLSDPSGQVSQLFGMYDDQSGTIQAGLVVLDDKGVVRMVVQGPPLHPEDVLTMTRHALRGSSG